MVIDRPETAEIKCPQCSNVSEVRGGEHTFCPTCDFPLFWADPTQSALAPAVRSAAIGDEVTPESPTTDDSERTTEDDLDAQASDIICRNCALRNSGDRTYCMRCGQELPPPDEWFNPDEPLQVETEPESSLWKAIIVPVSALVVVAAVTLSILHFGFDIFSSNPVVAINTIATGDGSANSIALVLEGDPPVPVIAHRNAETDTLRIIVCSDIECSGIASSTAVDTEGSPGLELAMDAIAGGPIVVYRREPTLSLVAVLCGTVECDNRSGARGFFSVDENEDVGYAPAIEVTGGVPVVVYSTGAGALKLAYLCRESCNESGGVILNDLPGTTEAGAPVSLAIPRAASPYIAFWNPDATALQLIHCVDVTCEQRSPSQPVTLVTGNFGTQSAMVIDSQSLAPTIAFRDSENGDLLMLSCGDEDCTPDNRSEVAVLDRGARATADHDVGHDIAMQRGPDGLPVVVYRDETAGALMIAICTEAPCTRDTVVIDILDDGGTGSNMVKVGYGNSLAITGDTAIVAYSDDKRAGLRVARVDISRVIEQASKTPASTAVAPTTGP